jgi:ABC-type multidrug transport system fused ATPase/permease subunit
LRIAARRCPAEERAYAVGHHTVIRKQLLATALQRAIATIWELILPLAQLLILGLGGWLVIQGRTSIGILMAFQAYIWRILDRGLTSTLSGYQPPESPGPFCASERKKCALSFGTRSCVSKST